MRTEFYDAYEDLYDLYAAQALLPEFLFWLRQRPGGRRMVRAVRKAIDGSTAASGSDNTLRPDAKLFLLINFHQMVILPQQHPSTANSPEENLVRDITADVGSIVESAAGVADGEITGGGILQAVAERWPSLRVNRTSLWG